MLYSCCVYTLHVLTYYKHKNTHSSHTQRQYAFGSFKAGELNSDFVVTLPQTNKTKVVANQQPTPTLENKKATSTVVQTPPRNPNKEAIKPPANVGTLNEHNTNPTQYSTDRTEPQPKAGTAVTNANNSQPSNNIPNVNPLPIPQTHPSNIPTTAKSWASITRPSNLPSTPSQQIPPTPTSTNPSNPKRKSKGMAYVSCSVCTVKN